MQRQCCGAFVFFASSSNPASTAPESAGFGAAFTASKMGLVGLVHAAARELASDHIRVNAIDPGLLPLTADDQVTAARRAEIVRVALQLCSPSADNITGQVVSI